MTVTLNFASKVTPMHINNWIAIEPIPGWMSKEELDWIAGTAAGVSSWTELGVYCGRSALCVALHLPLGATMNLVDLALGTQRRAGQSFLTTYEEICQRRPDLTISMHKMESTAAAQVVPDSDVVFIDAGHGYEHVRTDIAAWGPKCEILCGHDFNPTAWPGVVRAVKEAFPKSRNPAGSIWVR